MPRGYAIRSCSSQLSTKFILLIKTKMLKNKDSLSDVAFIMYINVEVPTIVGILTFIIMTNVMLSCVEHEKM